MKILIVNKNTLELKFEKVWNSVWKIGTWGRNILEITITKQLKLDFRISEITIITGCFELVGRVGMEKESGIFVSQRKIGISIIIEDYIIPVNFNNINAKIAINWTDAFKNNTLIQRNDEHSRIAIKKKRVVHFLTQLILHDGSSRNRERKGDFSVTPNKCNDLHSGIAIKRNGTAFF